MLAAGIYLCAVLEEGGPREKNTRHLASLKANLRKSRVGTPPSLKNSRTLARKGHMKPGM